MLLAAAAASLLLAASPLPPEKASAVLSLRNLGLAQLEEAKDKEARKTFEKLSDFVPGETLPWANGAVAALRMNDLPGSEKLLARARQAGGERADLLDIAAAIEEAKGNAEAARAAYAKAAALDARDLEARWRWVRSYDALPSPPPALRETKRKLLAEIVTASSANLPARLKLVLVEIDSGAADAKKALAELEKLLSDADARTKQLLSEARATLEKGDGKTAGLKARIVENLQRVTPRYQQSLGELFTNVVGLPLTRFSPALEAALRPKPGAGVPVAFHEAGPAEDPALAMRRVDLVNAGKREAYAVPAPHSAALFQDFDMDGDLDVYLYRAGGRPDRLLRNNMDGTWADVTAATAATSATGEPEVASARAVVVDLDRDGDPDVVAVDGKGELLFRSNLRQGRFHTRRLGVAGALDVAAEDLDADGLPDLAALTAKGVVVLTNKGDATFAREESEATAKDLAPLEPKRVLLADLDNDGFPDLVVGGAKGMAAFRRAASGFTAWNVLPAGGADDLLALDADKDGDLDLVAALGGKARLLRNDGGNANAWITVLVQGLPAGSGKINREGIGSLVEVKAGDLYVARTVGLLPTLVGIGSRGKADVVRVVMTNGVPQNAFDKRARSTHTEAQMLKGSCPFVYAKNGESGEWSFVSDALGRAPIGLLSDGVHLATPDPREWLLVSGDALRPDAENRLTIDYAEELWEAAYLDEATLMAVDHPEGTRVVPNERMVPFPLERKLFTAARPRPARRALSTVRGATTDVTERLARRDHVYVHPGPETAYQGLREEHALELDLGPVGTGDRVVLFLDGWIFYTDTSINVALSQRSDLRALPPVLEVPDARGGWKVAMESFGFPAGKTKTMPVDLTGVIDPEDPRVRIRTSLAIFWDEALVTVNDPAVPVTTTLLSPRSATLSFRGFSRRYRETEDGPELFAHDDVSTIPAWEDVPGRLTRYGDVTELLTRADDRYVAFQGGDAIRIAYDASALPPLPPGFRRDYVLVSDGWDKDFDKNTVTGQSVEPWPFHAMSAYPYPPGESHPDPAFLSEWMTREAGPSHFRSFVRLFPGGVDHRPPDPPATSDRAGADPLPVRPIITPSE